MIATLQGILTEASLLEIVVDVGGIGYAVHIPITTAEHLPAVGQKVKLYTHFVVREDAQLLYGFHSKEEREFFRLLIEHVSGIGPKIAINIMSKLSLPVLRQAIASGDTVLLAKCPGIGKKTAERLVVELKDKVGSLGTSAATLGFSEEGVSGMHAQGSVLQDAVSALVALGYKPVDADKAVRKAQGQLGDKATTEALIKRALS
ncbi:MAG: Holliday junction branch migration protein RuvA [Verrucomicrobiota bacterium]|nr:Holliday junction branch migration protein RuvA [Verrucomicrobiota bacterium]